MKRCAAALLLLAALTIVGCQHAPTKVEVVAPGTRASQPPPPAHLVSGMYRDLPQDATEAASALSAAKHDLADELSGFAFQRDEVVSLGGPSTAKELRAKGKLFLIPVYQVNATATADSSLWAGTRPIAGDYILGIAYHGHIVAASEWWDAGIRRGAKPTGWAEFYGFGAKSWASDEKELSDEASGTTPRLRYIDSPGGGWLLVSIWGGKMTAMLEPPDGDAYVDPPDLESEREIMKFLVETKAR